jgi:5-carboxymethyl-2-hydroxymuconate isomerase
METGRHFAMSGINSGHHNLPTYEISLKLNNVEFVVAILKMATGRNFSMSGINSGHHNLPTYEMSLKSDNVEFLRYCGGHFENGDR